MSLQWFPGHMTKARRELKKLLPSQDVVIEVLDARFPHASANPLLAEIRGDKPCIKVLSRADLADPKVTERWIAHLSTEPNVTAFASASSEPKQARANLRKHTAGKALYRGPDKKVRALITGIPNVGKSTFVNTLMHKNVADVGDKPAVTKRQQSVQLNDGTNLTDSPGLMWPKIEDEETALLLAFAGSIPDTAIDYIVTATLGANLLLQHYPELVVARYKLKKTPESGDELLHEIGRKRGGLRPGGVVDLHKAAEILIHEFRAGTLGRLSLEHPNADKAASESSLDSDA